MKVQARTRRDRTKERTWRRVVARQELSGLSARAFCRQQGLKECTFLWWRRELIRRDHESVPAAPTSSSEPRTGPPAAAFLPVHVVDDDTSPPPASSPIEILLPSGLAVRVPMGFHRQTLDAVLAVLEGRPC